MREKAKEEEKRIKRIREKRVIFRPVLLTSIGSSVQQAFFYLFLFIYLFSYCLFIQLFILIYLFIALQLPSLLYIKNNNNNNNGRTTGKASHTFSGPTRISPKVRDEITSCLITLPKPYQSITRLISLSLYDK